MVVTRSIDSAHFNNRKSNNSRVIIVVVAGTVRGIGVVDQTYQRVRLGHSLDIYVSP